MLERMRVEAELKKRSKRKQIGVNVLIGIGVAACVALGLFSLSAYRPPKKMRQVTGTIAKVKHYDVGRLASFCNDMNPYFRIWLADDSFFEVRGISYDKTDRALYENIRVGEEITITYNADFGSAKAVWEIEYNGVKYLQREVVFAAYEKERKGFKIFGAILIAVSVAAGGIGLFIVNYRYLRRKRSDA